MRNAPFSPWILLARQGNPSSSHWSQFPCFERGAMRTEKLDRRAFEGWYKDPTIITPEHCFWVKAHFKIQRLDLPGRDNNYTKTSEITWRLECWAMNIIISIKPVEFVQHIAFHLLDLFIFSGPWSSQSWWEHLHSGWLQWLRSCWTWDSEWFSREDDVYSYTSCSKYETRGVWA